MKTPADWIDEAERALPLAPELTVDIIHRIQLDALAHASIIVHTLSRGTKSDERSIAIDEARDAILEEHHRLENES